MYTWFTTFLVGRPVGGGWWVGVLSVNKAISDIVEVEAKPHNLPLALSFQERINGL